LNESKSSKVAIFQYANTGNWTELAKAFEATYKTFGKINIVINNAGIAGEGVDIWNDNDEAFEAMSNTIDVNFKGVTFGTRLAIKYLLKNGEEGGCILNTASIAGTVNSPYVPIYSSTKAAVINFTNSVALVSDKVNICIGVICPSFTDTPMMSDSRKFLKDGAFVDMKDVVESYFKFINDPKGLNGVTISPVYTGTILISEKVNTIVEDEKFSKLIDVDKYTEIFNKKFEENVKRMKGN